MKRRCLNASAWSDSLALHRGQACGVCIVKVEKDSQSGKLWKSVRGLAEADAADSSLCAIYLREGYVNARCKDTMLQSPECSNIPSNLEGPLGSSQLPLPTVSLQARTWQVLLRNLACSRPSHGCLKALTLFHLPIR